MKILAPVNRPEEVEQIIQAGADEIYCGVLPEAWVKRYTNIASPNRREWTAANLSSFEALKKVVDISHRHAVSVYLTVNAFYSQEQYPLMLDAIAQAEKIGVDAFIVGDLGLLLALRNQKVKAAVHISNTGTAFNSETVKFYKELGAARIILPRQLSIGEISELVASVGDIEFEVFIMNSGCRNIDGFCTFHHGVNEVLYPRVWNFFKKLGVDHYLLELVRSLPRAVSDRLRGGMAGIDSACLLNYKVSAYPGLHPPGNRGLCAAIASGFSLLSGADPCGACDLYQLKRIGVDSLKIVGRNYPTAKKIQDVLYVKKMRSLLEHNLCLSEDDFREKSKAAYVAAYHLDCRALCYRCEPAPGA